MPAIGSRNVKASFSLGVSYLVEGSVRRIAGRLRVTAKLIDAATTAHVWAERYDRDVDDVFALQDEVAQMIVSTLFGIIEHTKLEQTFRKPSDSLAAYDFCCAALPTSGATPKKSQSACLRDVRKGGGARPSVHLP